MQKYLTYRCCRNEEAKRSKHGNILNDNPVNDQPVIYLGPGLSNHTSESINIESRLNSPKYHRLIKHYFPENVWAYNYWTSNPEAEDGFINFTNKKQEPNTWSAPVRSRFNCLNPPSILLPSSLSQLQCHWLASPRIYKLQTLEFQRRSTRQFRVALE